MPGRGLRSNKARRSSAVLRSPPWIPTNEPQLKPHLEVLVQDEEVAPRVAVLVAHGADHDLAAAQAMAGVQVGQTYGGGGGGADRWCAGTTSLRGGFWQKGEYEWLVCR